MEKIAFIVSHLGSHTNCGGLTAMGKLQIADLMIKAATWFGVKPGMNFMKNVDLLSDRRPEDQDCVGLAFGLWREFADLANYRHLPYWWGRGSQDEERSTELIKMLEASKHKAAIVFGYMSKRTDQKVSHYDIDLYLQHWGISAEGLPKYGSECNMYLVDLKAKTVGYVPCVFDQK